jgi:hypothetical protein
MKKNSSLQFKNKGPQYMKLVEGKNLTYREKIYRELARREAAKRHLLSFRRRLTDNFLVNWHHRVLCEKLEAAVNGDLKRLIVSMPPRSGKSFLISEALPPWFFGKNPSKNVIAASYGQELAENFGRKVRNIMQDKKFTSVFPDSKLSRDNASVTRFSTMQGGEYAAVGAGGALTGKGGHLLLLDDPIKNSEEAHSRFQRDKLFDWYKTTFYTRRMPNASIVVVGTRWHEDDLIGRLVKQGGWEEVSFPEIAEEDDEYRKAGDILWPEWFNLEEITEAKETLGSYSFSALYQQKPISEESQEFKPSFFSYCEPSEAEDGECYISIDTAVSEKDSADYTGFTVVRIDRDGKWRVRAWHEKIGPKALIDRIFELVNMYKPRKVGIEKTVYVQAIKPFIKDEMAKRKTWFSVVELMHGGVAKVIRIRGLLPMYENGAIVHVRGACGDLESELLDFPKGRHDDVVDSLAYVTQMTGKPKFHFGIAKEKPQDFTEHQNSVIIDNVKGDNPRPKFHFG